MKNKVLIVGKGYIGQRLQKELGGSLSTQRISSFQDAVQLVRKRRPKILINCIGYTGIKNIDDCELDPDKSISSNTFVPVLLAEACLRHDVKFVHISSGCIYHYDYKKSKPLTETMVPDFFELYYSRTKIYAEHILNALSKKYNILITRIRVPLDNRPHPKNILTKLIKYKSIIDVPNSVTYIPDFIRALQHLIQIDAKGIYNVVNKGGLRYPDLMKIYSTYNPDFRFTVIKLEDLNLIRTNLILSTKKLESTHFKVRPIKDILEECVKNYLNCS
ncbi:MAG TPA: sugar nucleotide-binding protein [Candidatus Omnitrophota bacterium]|nr:sugar nucleotide-binding protein [Candidatus Omnitrophota bacterium]HQO58861.1 sugar nucleotide-binding protein [Candidatus Omnitrophota bacterium]